MQQEKKKGYSYWLVVKIIKELNMGWKLKAIGRVRIDKPGFKQHLIRVGSFVDWTIK